MAGDRRIQRTIRHIFIVSLLFIACPTAVFALPGDLDGSGRVDGYDLILFGRSNGSMPADARWNPDADLDGNDLIDGDDLSIMSSHFGKNGLSFALWFGTNSGTQRVMKLSDTGNLLLQQAGFDIPQAIASDISDGVVWVGDTSQSRIFKLDGADGAVLSTVNGTRPSYLAVDDQDGSLWISDTANGRIVRLDPDVADGYTVGTDTGSHIAVAGFNQPGPIAVDPETGTVWAVNTSDRSVIRLDPSAADGYDISSDTGKHTRIQGFSSIKDISLDISDHTLWVADYNFSNSRIVNLSAPGTTELTAVEGFSSPIAVAANFMDGSIWVADSGSQSVVRVSPDGVRLFTATGFDFNTTYTDILSINPLDGSCWVADTNNNQVVRLAPNGERLITVSIADFPISLSVTPDEVSLTRSPQASAVLDKNAADIGETVTFMGTGTDPDGVIILYEWDFEGDGVYDYSSDSTGQTTHSFSTLGVYNPVFRVTDDTWLTAADYSQILRIGSLTATATADVTSGVAPLTVAFDGSFVDPVDGKVSSYQWDFDGDNIFEFFSDSSPSTSFTYTKEGTYTAAFKITDGPTTAIDTITIQVTKATPTATATAAPASGAIPLTVQFTGSGTDPDGTVILYEWDFDNDGVYDWHSVTDGNTFHTYTTPGTKRANFRVTDSEGLTGETWVEIRVTAIPPVPVANAQPVYGHAPLQVDFDAQGSADEDGTITLYEWNFEGNCTDKTLFSDDMESGEEDWNPGGTWGRVTTMANSGSYSWTDSPGGNYGDGQDMSLTLKLLDLSDVSSATLSFWHRYDIQYGDSGRLEVTTDGGVTWTQIYSYAGTLSGWTQISVDLAPYLPSSDLRIRFRMTTNLGSVSDGWYVDDVAIDGCQLDWTVSADGQATHTYDTPGTYQAVLRATDDDGNRATDQVQIQAISADLPIASAQADVSTGTAPLTVQFTGSGSDPNGSISSFEWNFGEEYVWVIDSSDREVVRIIQDGSGIVGRYGEFGGSPFDLFANPSDGTAWAVDYANSGSIVKIAANVAVAIDTIPGFYFPTSVSVNPSDGTIWVANASRAEVVKLSAEGVELGRFSGFSYPYAVAASPFDDTVWVMDTGSGQLIRLESDGSESARIVGFSSLAAIAANPSDGTLWVADSSTRNVAGLASGIADGYDIGTDTGSHVSFGNTSYPRDLAVDPRDGSVWVADYYQVIKLQSDATELFREESFDSASGVSVNPVDGSVWVTDPYAYTYKLVKLAADGTELAKTSGLVNPTTVSVATSGAGNHYSSAVSGDTSHTYTEPGIYYPVFQVTDNEGNTSTQRLEILVYGQPSVTALASTASGPAPLKVFFSGTVTETDGTVVLYEWDFDGDGTYDYQSSISPDVQHTYQASGSYTAVLRATDSDGYTDTSPIGITVSPTAPEATIQAIPLSGNATLTVQFDGTGSDPDGSIVLYEWDFETDGVYDYSSPDTPETSHDYASAGTYTATFRVTDNDGLDTTESVSIRVWEAGGPIGLLMLKKTSGTTPFTADIFGYGLDLDGDIVQYELDVDGDGTYDFTSATPFTQFGDDMENGAGVWTADAPWGRVGTDSYSGSYCWTDSPSGDYENGLDTALTSATIDLSGATHPWLVFWHRYDLRSSDYGRLEISQNDGVSWTALNNFTNGTVADWSKYEVDLLAYAGQAQVKIRFRLTSNASITGDGWFIDDVWLGDAVSHTYTAHGQYDVGLRVTDNDGKQSVVSRTVSVIDRLNRGIVWAVDSNLHQLTKLADDGQHLALIKGFSNPRRVSVDPTTGDAWVADTNNDRVIRFGYDVQDGYDTAKPFVADSSPVEHGGAVNGDTAADTGQINGGMYFDGSGDYIQIPDSEEYRMTSWTMEAWIKPESFGSIRTIVGKVSQSKDFALVLNGDKIGVLVYNSGRKYVTAASAATAGQWYHVAATYSADDAMLRLYVDGVFIDEAAYVPNTTNTDPLLIGKSNCCTEYFAGVIDDVRVWDVARTEAEIASAKDGELTGTETGLVGYWKLDDFTSFHQVTTGIDAPYDVAIDSSEDRVWVVGYLDHELVKLASDGTELSRFSGLKNPRAVDVDSSRGIVWVGDTGNDRVLRIGTDIPDGYQLNAQSIALDETANQLPGYVLGDTAETSGYLGDGVYMDGYLDYIEIPSQPALDLQSFTVEAWIKGLSVSGRAIFMRGNDSGTDEIYFGFSTNNTIEAIIDASGSLYFGDTINFIDGNWHHVALVYDAGTGQLSCFADGSPYGSPQSVSATLEYGQSKALIGADYDGFNTSVGNFFYGSIDEVRIWNFARSQSEISSAMGSELPGTPSELVAYFKLNSLDPPQFTAIAGFNDPIDLDVAPTDGSVWVSDYYNNQVVKLSGTGTELFRASGFDNPIGIAAGGAGGKIWVADYDNDQVAALDANGFELHRLNGFNNPHEVDVNPADGTVWVADFYNGHVVKLAANGSELLRLDGYSRPISVAVDPGARNQMQPPSPSASAVPLEGDAPLPVDFTGSATDDGTVVSYEWDFDGDGSFDFFSPATGDTTHTYTESGVYTPVFRVADDDGMISSIAPLSIYVGPLSVTATASPSSGLAKLTTTLDGTVTGLMPDRRIVAYDWDFDGDGIYDYNDSGTPETSHTYLSAGVYTAVLRVTDDQGDQGYADVVVTVEKNPPTAYNSASPTSGNAPLTVQLNGSGSDSDGSIVRYEWDYDGNGTYDWFSETTANTVFTYTEPGTYNTVFKVTDNDGEFGTATRTITVNEGSTPVAPVAEASANETEGNAPFAVQFTGTGTDPDAGGIALYEWDFEGDGVIDYSSPTSGSTEHTYTVPGVYNALFQVTDADALSDTARLLITVKTAQAPTAQANASPTTGETPLTVQFDATGSSDPDGVIARYDWYFSEEVLWVADTSHNKVKRFEGLETPEEMTGFSSPHRLILDPSDGSAWVSDQYNNQVVKMRSDGQEELLRIDGFNQPRGLSLDLATGNLWVADFNNHQVVKLSPEGNELLRLDGFDNPTHVAVEPSDQSVWVTDRDHNQVVRLAEDGTEMARFDGFNRPEWVTLDPRDGAAWIADTYNNRMVKLRMDTPGGFNANAVGAAADESSANNTGALFGDVAVVPGQLGNGMNFDGSGDYIQAMDADAFSLTDWTLEAWIKPAVFGGIRTIAGKVSQSKDFALVINGDKIGVLVYSSGRRYVLDTVAATADQWYHVAAVCDATATTVTLYVDGAYIGEASYALDSSNTDPFMIGKSNCCNEYFSGVIDDVRVWNTAREENQIADNKDTALSGTESGLVGYWKLDESIPYAIQTAGFTQPQSAAVNPLDGSVWVCDTNADQMVLIPSDGSREIVRVGGFNNPVAAAVNPNDGSLWVADYYNSSVAHLTPEGEELRRIVDLSYPSAVAIDADSGASYTSADSGDATHSFTRTGNYLATLTVTDNDGFSDTDSVLIHAGIFPQSLPIAYPTVGVAPLAVRFSASGSSPTGTIEYFRWDFDGDGNYNWTTRISENYTYTYQYPGVYYVTQTVEDNRGLTDSETFTVTVLPPEDTTAPKASASAAPLEGPSPLDVDFVGLGRDGDGFLTLFEWDFDGDGTYDYQSSTTGLTTHTYTADGNYSAKLRVTDNDAKQATDDVKIEVKPAGSPQASADASPASGLVSLTVAFSGQGTDNGTITLYEWDFDGDGTYDWSSTGNGNTYHTYSQPGIYDAVLRVTDDSGLTDIDTVNINVSVGLGATLSNDVLDPYEGETVNVNSILTGDANVTILIKDRVGQIVRTLVENASRPAGYYSDPWDGRDEGGQLVSEGVYLFVIEYETDGRSYTYDLTNNVDASRYTPSVVYPDAFDPFSSETNFFRYTLNTKSEITVYISPFQGGVGIRAKTLLLRKPQKAGSYVLVWDGTDDQGNLVPEGTYVIAVMAWRLPENAIIVAAAPIISDLLVSPTFLNPAAQPYDDIVTATFTYTLSKEADVVARIYDDDNYLAKSLTIDDVPQGTGNSIVWDGKDSQGRFVAPGTYRLRLIAVDASGNESQEANALIQIFY